MQLCCPFCGVREVAEFRFRTVAANPDMGSSCAAIYERLDIPTRSIEYWQHLRGCRAWLLVIRNPSSGSIESVRALAGG